MSLPLPSTHRTVWPAIPVNHLTFPNRSLLYNAADIKLNICSPRPGRRTVPFSYFLDGGEDLLDVVFGSAACLCAAGSSRHLDAFLIHLQIPLKLQDRAPLPVTRQSRDTCRSGISSVIYLRGSLVVWVFLCLCSAVRNLLFLRS